MEIGWERENEAMIIGPNLFDYRSLPQDAAAAPEAAHAEPLDSLQLSMEAQQKDLELSKKVQEQWKQADLWNLRSIKLPEPKFPFLWVMGKKLSRAQNGKMRELIKAGVRPAYARKLVELGQTSMIDYILKQAKRGKKR